MSYGVVCRATIAAFVLLNVGPLQAEDERATVRVEARSSAGIVEGAQVTINGVATRTGTEGVAISSIQPGKVEITVLKQGFFPAKTSLTAGAGQVYVVRIDLQQLEEVEEEVRV